jgi:hypothetical protein
MSRQFLPKNKKNSEIDVKRFEYQIVNEEKHLSRKLRLSHRWYPSSHLLRHCIMISSQKRLHLIIFRLPYTLMNSLLNCFSRFEALRATLPLRNMDVTYNLHLAREESTVPV